jgi:signal transduction histidine kinase
VFLNLLVNAAHAIGDVTTAESEKGRIRISTVQEGNMVHIAVQDTGSGIPEAVRGRIFDPFFTTKDVGKGTGQGLAISRSIVVDKHGGSIHFDTASGVGTTFHIVVPVGPA